MGQYLHEIKEKGGSFYYEEDGQRLGEMVYVSTGTSKIIIEHTEVDPSLAGKGVGKRLLQELVEYARREHLKVLPVCPFAKATFDKVKEWQDVLF